MDYPDAAKQRLTVVPGAVAEPVAETMRLDFEAEPQPLSQVGKARQANASLAAKPQSKPSPAAARKKR
jgi:hypothetical protein